MRIRRPNQWCWFAIVIMAAISVGTGSAAASQHEFPIAWMDNYQQALEVAAERSQMALVWFYDPVASETNERFERDVLSQSLIADAIAERCVVAKLPLDAKSASEDIPLKLLDHPAFADMQHSPGLAMIDMTDSESPLFRQVVSVYPFTRGTISAEKLAVLLALPRGTLTQRTLMFAVRTHREGPRSTEGEFSSLLARETESHASHQARINRQGHHNWETRFHAINARLPSGLLAREVCAESWPGQGLVEAAEECVHSWRQSPGHWEAVRTKHALFGYDMKRGSNGVWYAAGIFGGRDY
jgi:hypothetical protein